MPTKTNALLDSFCEGDHTPYVLVMISQFAEFLITLEKALIGYGLNVLKLDTQLSEKRASRYNEGFHIDGSPKVLNFSNSENSLHNQVRRNGGFIFIFNETMAKLAVGERGDSFNSPQAESIYM